MNLYFTLDFYEHIKNVVLFNLRFRNDIIIKDVHSVGIYFNHIRYSIRICLQSEYAFFFKSSPKFPQKSYFYN